MFPDDQDSPTSDDIVSAASSQIGSLGYKRYGYSDNTPAGVPKDDNFIANTLDRAGLGFGDTPFGSPSAADWADPSSNIPGWQPVTDGSVQAGDVLATPKPIARNWYEGGGQQLGVATGNGTSIGIVDNNRIGESDWGFKDGHNPTVWRSSVVADASAPGTTSADAGGDDSLPPPAYGSYDDYDKNMPTLLGGVDSDKNMPVIKQPIPPIIPPYYDPKAQSPIIDGLNPKYGRGITPPRGI